MKNGDNFNHNTTPSPFAGRAQLVAAAISWWSVALATPFPLSSGLLGASIHPAPSPSTTGGRGGRVAIRRRALSSSKCDLSRGERRNYLYKSLVYSRLVSPVPRKSFRLSE